jgi:hypothetical protein
LHCVSSTMPLLTASLLALLLITQSTSGAMCLTKQTVRSSDMVYSKCMVAGCFYPNPKNSGRIVMLLSGGSSVSRQRREQIGFYHWYLVYKIEMQS